MSSEIQNNNANPISNAPKPTMGRPIDEAKHAAILEAASESFYAFGFAGTSIEKVAAMAEVSKVTIYNHFRDKRGLFTAAVETECRKIGDVFNIDVEEGARDKDSLEDRLFAIGQAMHLFLSRPEIVQFERRIAAETEHDPAIGTAFLSAGPWQVKDKFSTFLQNLTAKGKLEIEDTMLASEQFVAMCKGMGDLEQRFGVKIDEERNHDRIAGAVKVFLKAYRPAK